MVVVILALAVLGALLVLLTGLGARRRGLDVLPASVAGLFFPLTWIVWYVRDEHPYRRGHQHV